MTNSLYLVTIRTDMDTGPLKAKAAGVPAILNQINVSQNSSLKDHIRAIEEANRAEAKAEQAAHAEATRILKQKDAQIAASIKQEATTKQGALNAALQDIKRMEAERARIMQSGDRAVEAAAKRVVDTQVKEAKRAATAFANSLGSGTKELQQAEHGAGKLGTAFKVLAGSAVVAEGPMGGMSKQIQSLSAEASELSEVLAGSGGLVIGLVAVAAVIAAAALVVGAMTELTISGAEKFGEYGSEIFKLNAATKISTEALSGLMVVAKETNTDTTRLGLAFSRLQVNIEKGIIAPTGPAAMAIKTLGLNLETLKHQTPTEQVAAVAKAIDGLHNQNVKALVSNTLLGRGFQQLAPMLKILGGNLDEATHLAEKFGLNFSPERVEAAHHFEIAVRDLGLAWEGFKIALGEGAVTALTAGLNVLSETIAANRDGFIQFGKDVGDVVTNITKWFVDNRAEIIEWAKWSVKASEDVLSAVWSLSKFLYTAFAEPVVIAFRFVNKTVGPGSILGMGAKSLAGYDPYDAPSAPAASAALKKFAAERSKEATDALFLPERTEGAGNDAYAGGGSGKHKGHAQETDLQRLQKEYSKLTGEVNALHDAGSKEFVLKYQVEDLKRFKGDLESILTIQHKIGEPMDVSSLATITKKSTPAEITAATRAVQDNLRVEKLRESIFDDVTKALYAQGEAEAKIAALRQTSIMPVLSAETRHQKDYITAVQERRNAEQQLTADLMTATKLRADAVNDEVGSRVKAYQSLRLDVEKQLTDLDEELRKNSVLAAVFGGNESALRADVTARIDLTAPNITDPMTKTAEHAANIENLLVSIAGKVGVDTTKVMGGKQGQIAHYTSGVHFLQNPSQDKPDITTSTSDTNFLLNQERETARKRADVTLGFGNDATTVAANRTILQNNALLKIGLTSIEGDIALMRSNKQVQRLTDERSAVLNIKSLEDDLADIERGDLQSVSKLQHNADQDRLNSRIGLKQSIVSLESEIAHAGEDSADRYRVAQLSAIRDVQDADVKANEQILASQIHLADAMNVHAPQVRAGVLQHLEQVKTVSQSMIESLNSSYDKLTTTVDASLNRTLHGLGLIKDMVVALVNQLLSRVFQSFLNAFLGGGPSASGGQQSGSSIFGGFLSNISGSGNSGGSRPPSGSGIGGFIQNLLNTGTSGSAGISTPASASNWSNIMNSANASQMSNAASLGGRSGGLGSLAGLGQSLMASGPALAVVYGAETWMSILSGHPVSNFQALTGGGLLGFFINRSLQRKQDEKVRNQASIDTLPAVYQILFAAQRGELTITEARTQWDQVHNDYLQKISGIKDSKTKRNATLWWDNDVTPIWTQIETAAKAGEKAKGVAQAFSPTFASGGLVPWMGSDLTTIKVKSGERIDDARGFSWVAPGQDRGYDNIVTTAAPGSAVRTRSQQADFPAFATGSDTPVAAGARDVVIKADSSRLAAILSLLLDGLRTEEGGKIIVQQMNKDFENKGADGSLGTIFRELAKA